MHATESFVYGSISKLDCWCRIWDLYMSISMQFWINTPKGDSRVSNEPSQFSDSKWQFLLWEQDCTQIRMHDDTSISLRCTILVWLPQEAVDCSSRMRIPWYNTLETHACIWYAIFLRTQAFIVMSIKQSIIMEMQTDSDGVYCSTAGAVFQERESLQEHYHSEFHRYANSFNLLYL